MTAPVVSKPPYEQVPVLDMGPAIGCLVLNVIVPGLGTLVAGIVGVRPMIGRAIAQFFLAIIIVGWVWSIVTGVQLATNASWADRTPGARAKSA